MALLIKQHRRNPTRNRRSPKRYEDETFVSGAIDRYQRSFNGRFKEGTLVADAQDTDYHFTNHFDYTESLLEFTSIWRDFGRVLPGNLVENIGKYLRLRRTDKQKGMITADDEFIVADDEVEEKVPDKSNRFTICGYKKNCIEDSDEELWDSDGESDYDSEEEKNMFDALKDDDESSDEESEIDGYSDDEGKWEDDPRNGKYYKKEKKVVDDVPTHDGWNHRWGCPPI